MRDRPLYYGMDGQPLTRDQMAALYEGDFDKTRRVAQEFIGDVRVSTVLLAIDHQVGEGPPLIFETMIFGGKYDEEQWRYSTREEAEAGHARAVALVKSSGPEGQPPSQRAHCGAGGGAVRWFQAYLRDLRECARILASRDFWRAFRAYWHPSAVEARVDEWIVRARDRMGLKPDWDVERRIAKRHASEDAAGPEGK